MSINSVFKFVHTRIFRALTGLLILSAVIHLVLLGIHSVGSMDFSLFNFFDIVDLDLFFPNIAIGQLSLFSVRSHSHRAKLEDAELLAPAPHARLLE